MENLIWLIAIGALFFLMMRWGCGAGHSHGGHRNEHDHGGSDEDSQHKHKAGGCH